MTVTSSAGKRGYYSGKVFAAPWGTTDFLFLGDVEVFTFSGTVTKTQGMANDEPTKPVDEIIVTGETCTTSLTLKEISPENAAIALRASISTITTGSVTKAFEAAPPVGGYISLPDPFVSAVGSITSDPTGTTYTANTDYVFTTPSPMIYVPTGSTLAGEPIIVNYTKAAAKKVNAFKTDVDYYTLRYFGFNSSSKKAVEAIAHKVFFDPAQVNEFISQSGTLKQWQISGDLLFDRVQGGHYSESFPDA
jgi:hypothetical protein